MQTSVTVCDCVETSVTVSRLVLGVARWLVAKEKKEKSLHPMGRVLREGAARLGPKTVRDVGRANLSRHWVYVGIYVYGM